jgi:hypothetical protein
MAGLTELLARPDAGELRITLQATKPTGVRALILRGEGVVASGWGTRVDAALFAAYDELNGMLANVDRVPRW